MSVQPFFSVIVPTYKRGEKLARALASIPAAISGRAYEIIVIDDCPEGSGFEVARLAGARYLNKAGKDRGLSASRNLGLDLARGLWVAFLDDDDFFAPQGLDHLLEGSSHGAHLVYGNYTTFGSSTRTDVNVAGFTVDDQLVCNRIPAGSYAVQRAAIRRRFDERMRSHEDWDFLLSLLLDGPHCHVPQVVVLIDKTENETESMQARRRAYFWLDFLTVYARFPAPHLAGQRSEMLTGLGVAIPSQLLELGDAI